MPRPPSTATLPVPSFEKPKSGRVAVKVINHLGDEVMKVFKVYALHRFWRNCRLWRM